MWALVFEASPARGGLSRFFAKDVGVARLKRAPFEMDVVHANSAGGRQ